ncbi:winged helix-turn-helix transcriptional regulator [Candidatus Uhrbacteria bacterium]|nr:winged helix-turn-helix transcriptional regulator [Candidatus Uhrbacteria bacterium]
MKALEKNLKAIANRRRLAILSYLKKNREATVGDIADTIHLSFTATSKHLGILFAVDILDKEQRSLEIYYRLGKISDPMIRTLISIL